MSKAPLPIELTDFPIVTDFMPKHSLKAYLPIVFTELPMVSKVRLQPLKAYAPISVTELGIVSFVVCTLLTDLQHP